MKYIIRKPSPNGDIRILKEMLYSPLFPRTDLDVCY